MIWRDLISKLKQTGHKLALSALVCSRLKKHAKRVWLDKMANIQKNDAAHSNKPLWQLFGQPTNQPTSRPAARKRKHLRTKPVTCFTFALK